MCIGISAQQAYRASKSRDGIVVTFHLYQILHIISIAIDVIGIGRRSIFVLVVSIIHANDACPSPFRRNAVRSSPLVSPAPSPYRLYT